MIVVMRLDVTFYSELFLSPPPPPPPAFIDFGLVFVPFIVTHVFLFNDIFLSIIPVLETQIYCNILTSKTYTPH